MKKILSNIKLFFSDKKTKIIFPLAILSLTIIITIIKFLPSITGVVETEKIKDIQVDDAKKLYENTTSVSCSGDLHFDEIVEYDKEYKVKDIDKTTLLNYLFSNLDKQDKLSNEMKKDLITDTAKSLFNDNLDLLSAVEGYQYRNYVYHVTKDSITRRTKKECTSEYNYKNYMYGYSWNSDILSIDINIGYVKDNILYNIDDTEIGKYDANEDITIALDTKYFYRLNYVKKDSTLKLDSISIISRS